jgi:hypothetical protein
MKPLGYTSFVPERTEATYIVPLKILFRWACSIHETRENMNMFNGFLTIMWISNDRVRVQFFHCLKETGQLFKILWTLPQLGARLITERQSDVHAIRWLPHHPYVRLSSWRRLELVDPFWFKQPAQSCCQVSQHSVSSIVAHHVHEVCIAQQCGR